MDAVIVLLILLFVLLAIGVPVGFAIGGATMISMFFFSDLNMVVNAQYCYSGIFSFTVMAIPYFMLAGTIMSTGGIARRIVDFASALIDFVTGALGYPGRHRPLHGQRLLPKCPSYPDRADHHVEPPEGAQVRKK